MLPTSIHPLLTALASALYMLLMNRATPCHLRDKILKFTKELKADLPADALMDIEAEEAKAIIEAASYFL